MNRDLYFLPIIADALRQRDRTAALGDAFATIHRLGALPEFAGGYTQFRTFMSIVQEESTLDLLVERDNTAFGVLKADLCGRTSVIGGILPGDYRVKLSTGRIIWGGFLTEKELVLTAPTHREALKLAADTRASPARQARVEALLNDAMELYVFAGQRTGYIGVRIFGHTTDK